MIYKLPKVNQCRKDFLIDVLILFLSIKGRINFLQLIRYRKYIVQRYRLQFEKTFDFLAFNEELTLSLGSGKYAIDFDPSYISKSGKNTQGVGWYWPGCANQAICGLEIGNLATIGIENHTAFHLEALQTLNDSDQNLTDIYAGVIENRKDTRKLYFSLYISMNTDYMLLHYQSSYQIEFLYRDGKQHTGLYSQCQILKQ